MKTVEGRRKTGHHHGDLRGALMNVAVAMVASGDEGSLSLREVARRAGVSPAAPYNHFADKDMLLAAIAVDGFQKLDAALEQAAVGGRTPRTRLARMATEYVRFALAHRSHYRIMLSPALGRGGAHPNLQAAAMASFVRLAAAVHATAANRSELEVRRCAGLCWALAHGTVLLHIDGVLAPLGVAKDDEDLARQVGTEVANLAAGR